MRDLVGLNVPDLREFGDVVGVLPVPEARQVAVGAAFAGVLSSGLAVHLQYPGAGAPEHFTAVFREAGVDAALAASVFHTGAIAIPDLKRTLRAARIEVRI